MNVRLFGNDLQERNNSQMIPAKGVPMTITREPPIDLIAPNGIADQILNFIDL